MWGRARWVREMEEGSGAKMQEGKRYARGDGVGDWGHSSCLESLYLLSLFDELSAAVDGGVGGLRLLDTASLPLPSYTSAAVLLSIISS